jgi:heptosyltransferase-1
LIASQVNAPIKVGFKTPPEWPNKWFTNKKYDPPSGRNIRSDYLYLAQSHLRDLSPFNDPGVQLRLTEPQQKVLDSVKLPQGPLVMVCPGSAWRNKQLSDEALEQFLKRVQSHLNCTFLLVWGNQEERALAERLNQSLKAQVIDRLPLPVLQNLMARMQLVIAMDSLPLHLAGTTAVPTFSVFGSSIAAKYRPEGEQHRSYQGPCPYGRTFDKRCPILRTCKTGSCIRGLSGDVLFEQYSSNS